MNTIKRKIALDNYTSREQSNWGKMTATTFNINIFITQDADDMGISTEVPFIAKGEIPADTGVLVDYTKLNTKLALSGYTFEYMNGTTTSILESGAYPNTRYPGKTVDQYYINGIPVTGLTEDRLDAVTSYDANMKYKPGFDISKESTTDYQGNPYNAGTRVITNTALNPITYFIDGDTSLPIKTKLDTKRGIYFSTSTATTRTVTGTIFSEYDIPYTEMYYNSEGFNETNVHLSAETKEEYLFGITSSPTVFNDLFIDRGRATVIQSHMQLGEIRNMAELINYGNGFYKIRR